MIFQLLAGNICQMFFILLAVALINSLTFSEYGHGMMARMIGDDSAERSGRLTLNPVPQIDPVDLLMVPVIGYARAVPVDPRGFSTRWDTPPVDARSYLESSRRSDAYLLPGLIALNFTGVNVVEGVQRLDTSVLGIVEIV